jgi:hypothetical protein
MTDSSDLPDGTVACLEYEARLPDRSIASIVITLGDRDAPGVPAAYAGKRHADCYGLVSILVDGVTAFDPLMWMLVDGGLVLVSAQEAPELGEEWQPIVARYLGLFLVEIEPDARPFIGPEPQSAVSPL